MGNQAKRYCIVDTSHEHKWYLNRSGECGCFLRNAKIFADKAEAKLTAYIENTLYVLAPNGRRVKVWKGCDWFVETI